MQLKLSFRSFILYFDIIGGSLELKDQDTLFSTISSLEGFKFLNRKKPFNELMLLQQKNPKHILVEKDTNAFDEFRYYGKAIYNFLLETNQLNNFMLDSIEWIADGKELKMFGTESLVTDFEDFTVSPTIRAEWNKPILIEKIIKN